ncbi:MAG: S-layer homology domain-containing protein [Actinomycetes bacterium]|nr:S-layer homology domain-containing protein [Acidimicrobiia bacterium]
MTSPKSLPQSSPVLALFTAAALIASLIAIWPTQAAAQVDRFSDDNRSIHEPAINALAEAGLVVGCNPPANDSFCPDRPVTRGEIASILVRAKKLDPVSASRFVDIGGNVHAKAVGALEKAGIARGCNPPRNDRFCPTKPVSRGEMAALLVRAFDLAGGQQRFVDASGVFSADIAAVAAAGWVKGCNPPKNDRFCPDRSVTRAELATVLVRALDLPTYVIDHPEEPEGDSGGSGGGSGGGGSSGGSGGGSGVSPTTTTTRPRESGGPTGGRDYPGQPAIGKIYWGAVVGSNSDPGPRHETPSGHTLSVRRTYFSWAQRTGSMIRIARDDVAKGRLPWVSVKTPVWADVAAGKHDAEIDEMLRALDALDGPVWLTVWHEPENDLTTGQTPSSHLEMNRRVRQRMEALGVDNVALVQCLMAWTYDPRSGRDPAAYFDKGVYDLLSVTVYRNDENSMLTTPYWWHAREWVGARGLDIAVAEWGIRGSDTAAANRMKEFYDHAVNSNGDGRGARVVALSYFDTYLNSSSGSWELVGEQLKMFHKLMGEPTTALP